ncbi:MAG: CotH kinase family protein [Verrucomicrobia bacterium]|nr:CotH kinase family protein [Verrucomicrobiota bacterium]
MRIRSSTGARLIGGGGLRAGVFATQRVLARVDEMAAQLNEAQARNFRRWPIMGRRVNPNDFVGDTYEEEIKWMKQWIQKRLSWIDSQFIAPPAIAETTGAIALRSGTGKNLFPTSRPVGSPLGARRRCSLKSPALRDSVSLRNGQRLLARSHRNGWSALLNTSAARLWR